MPKGTRLPSRKRKRNRKREIRRDISYISDTNEVLMNGIGI